MLNIVQDKTTGLGLGPLTPTKAQFSLYKKTEFFVCACTLLLLICLIVPAHAQGQRARTSFSPQQKQAFAELYRGDFDDVRECPDSTRDEIIFCASDLKDSGNGPRIFLPSMSSQTSVPKAIIVLFHGLSDSPYFVRSLAQSFQKEGYVVITPLTPGHGKKSADLDMQDPKLGERWLKHVDDVMRYTFEYANAEGGTPNVSNSNKALAALPVFIGGFSTGGTLATLYAVKHPKKVAGILLFSAALELPDSAETMSRIWGIKSVAAWLDGVYEAKGAHPYKYPTIASYSGLILMDLVKELRIYLDDGLNEETLNVPIFAAHSLADKITMFSGIENLLAKVPGKHMLFQIDEEYDLCHQDLPMSNIQLIGLNFDRTQVNQLERCAIPKANPLHQQMMSMANLFVAQRVAEITQSEAKKSAN